MNITPLVRPFFTRRIKQIERYATQTEDIQRKVLAKLLRQARATQYADSCHITDLCDYEQFASLVPLNDYESLKGYIERMRHGEKNILWPDSVKWYAKSSGTTNDKSKFIPVSAQGLRDTHYAGGADAVALYLHNNPSSRLFAGKALILGGSHAPNYNLPDSLVGDLSAILIENVSPFVNLFRIPDKQTALLPDFEEKRDKIARMAMRQNVTNLSGVPSWMMSVIKRMLEISEKDTLDEIWPELEVFFHGGIAFTPYRELYHSLIRSPRMHYMETYNASEGFFGLQSDLSDPAMLLMIDYGVFYEFIPLEEVGHPHPNIVPLWGIEVGKNYAMVITTSGGLWRYQIGDTIRFTQKNPYKFKITGRTKSFINAFGEELIVDNAERGLKEACEQTGAIVSEYTAAPVFMDRSGQCRHQWLIEFSRKPANLDEFGQILDKALQRLNSDYEAKRYKDITLQPLEIVEARTGLFDDWLSAHGKLGGQHKIPRLNNNRHIIEELLELN
ncbi:MAG: GH3 auxin-responsive promoter family protein [Alloprevotella sp.]|nr:GH3 auxin-responsive promoter family protein [Alloprevotella sp.]